MDLQETAIAGAFLVKPQPIGDERGYFARLYDRDLFAARGLADTVSTTSVSYNRVKGTLRGMHYQVAPYQEIKLVSCIRGAVFDVIVDLRRDSPSYLRWIGARLDAASHTALYIPAGCAHGFITLEDDSVVSYAITGQYHPASARGVRFDDPAFAIDWPLAPAVINERDRTYPLFQPAQAP